MNIQQIEYIVALDEHRHFGRASEHCDVSQPTLSTMVQKLEEELGVRLFERSRSAIIPTAVGRLIIDQGRSIIDEIRRLKEIAEDAQASISGSVTIALLPTIAPYLLPRLSPIIAEALPDLQINFAEMITSECIEALHSGEVDMAIIASEGFEGMRSEPLYYEEFYGYVSRTNPIYHEEIIRSSQVDPDQLWLLDEGHCFRDQLMRFCQLRRSVHAKLSYRRGSLQTFMHMVERGQGMTFIPALSLETIHEEYRDLVRPFAIPRPCRGISLCMRSHYARIGLVDKLIALIRQSVPAEMLTLQRTNQLV